MSEAKLEVVEEKKSSHFPNNSGLFAASSVSPAQNESQQKLIKACETGNLYVVCDSVKEGAQIIPMDSKAKQPLGAAIYGMNPKVVDYLLAEIKKMHPKPLIDWEACVAHNLKEYKAVFMFDRFAPENFDAWKKALIKMSISKEKLEALNQLSASKENFDAFKEALNQLSASDRGFGFLQDEHLRIAQKVFPRELYVLDIWKDFHNLIETLEEYEGDVTEEHVVATFRGTENKFKEFREGIKNSVQEALGSQLNQQEYHKAEGCCRIL